MIEQLRRCVRRVSRGTAPIVGTILLAVLLIVAVGAISILSQEIPYTPVETAAFVLTTATAIGGIFIAYHAYRGLRRNDSTPMWYLSIGLIVLFGVTYLVSIIGQTLIQLRVLGFPMQDYFRLLVRALQLAGVSMIAYSMWIATRTPDL